jgi:hypothetical protein
MSLKVRRTVTIVERHLYDAGRRADVPLQKVAEIAILENPYAGRYVEDLTPLFAESVEIAREMAARAVRVLDGEVEGYGKAGVVGTAGEKEHANALLTTAFATPFREAIGGGEAWISSVTKVAAAGALVDVPMNSKDNIWIRSHYDTMSLVIPDAPLPDEIVLIFCLSTGGRLNARVGGPTLAELKKHQLQGSLSA